MAALMVAFAACKKLKDDLLEQKALDLLDGTRWKVTSYLQGSTNVSTAFGDLIFRFNDNLTVEAFRNNRLVATGQYKGDIPNRTIFAGFPPTSAPPLPLLNATWTITKSTMTSLTATAAIEGKACTLKMEKQD